ncbi:MAG: hypothetical protein JWO81_941 [Alphaproteobacteria bacterium]|nr:hypothetical protein [Alphaproteobacteria bacterium]
MSRRRAPTDEARVVSDLEAIRDGAMEDRTWAPALRAVELLGKNIGMWTGDTQPQTSLADMINEAAAKAGDAGRQP